MTTTTNREPILSIARKRALYGETGLSRDEISDLALISPELLDALESCSRLPAFVEGLLRIASALQVPVEELIAPQLLRRIRLAVARRRAAREGGCPTRHEIGFRCRDHDA